MSTTVLPRGPRGRIGGRGARAQYTATAKSMSIQDVSGSTESRRSAAMYQSPSSWKYVASLRKSTVIVRFSRVGLAAVPMCHPQVIRSRQRIRHDGGNASKSQDTREGLRALPLKAMECANFYRALHCWPVYRAKWHSIPLS